MLVDANFVITTVATVVGSGLGTAIVATFLKRRFDSQLARQQALHARGSAVHKEQVDALLTIHAGLTQLHEALASWNLNLRHSVSDTDHPARVQALRAEVKKNLESARLILPEDIVADMDNFFSSTLWLSHDLGYVTLGQIANRNLPAPQEPATVVDHDALDKVIYGQLYPMLRTIAARSRRLIHVEPEDV